MLRKTPFTRIITTIAGLAVACTLAASPAAAAGTSSSTSENSVAAAPIYRAVAPIRIATGDIRFPVTWSFAPQVKRVCMTANYSGNGVVPGGPVTSRCWNVTNASGGRSIDISCSFYGGVWSSASFYDGSGRRLAYRESSQSYFIC